MAAEKGFLAAKMAMHEERAWQREMLSVAQDFVRSKEDRGLLGTDFSAYTNAPIGFFRDILGIELWSRQAEIANALVAHERVAAKTGHKIGKSLMAAGLCLWWACTRPDALVLITAPGYDQVKGIIWKELQRLHKKVRPRIGGVIPLDPSTGLRLSNGSEIIGMATNTPERVAGRSGAAVLVIVDEASGYPDPLWEALQTSAAGGDDGLEGAGEARILAIGNPTQTSGWFFEIFRTANPDWSAHTVSSEETPNVVAAEAANDNGVPLEKVVPGLATLKFISILRRACGADYRTHPIYMVRVLGQYPERSSAAVIAMSDVECAQSDARRKTAFVQNAGEVCLGVDVARFGDDDSVIAPRVGDRVFDLEVHAGLSGTDLAARVLVNAAGWLAQGYSRVRVNVDGAGVGASVYDALVASALVKSGKVYVVDVNASAKPDANDEERYLNMRAQLWFQCAVWLKTGSIPDDGELARELLAPEYKINAKNLIQVLGKDDIKKKIGRSPDRADALCLAIYRGGSHVIDSARVQPTAPTQETRTKGGRYNWKSGGGAG